MCTTLNEREAHSLADFCSFTAGLLVPRLNRLSSHSRLNAFVIQTKLNYLSPEYGVVQRRILSIIMD